MRRLARPFCNIEQQQDPTSRLQNDWTGLFGMSIEGYCTVQVWQKNERQTHEVKNTNKRIKNNQFTLAYTEVIFFGAKLLFESVHPPLTHSHYHPIRTELQIRVVFT